MSRAKQILIGILLLTAFLRIYRLDYPNGYVFDEVYHAFTAKEYSQGKKEAWEWWTTPPPGVAFEWTHPPLAKEFMAVSMYFFHSTEGWAWRLPNALMGVLSIYLLYLITKQLFKNEETALVSAFIFSLDGLNFVQSRTGMNDIYFVTFMLASVLFFIKKNFLISAIFFGLSFASKWAAMYLLGMYAILILLDETFIKVILHPSFASLKQFLGKYKVFIISFIFVPLGVYLLSYLPFFLQGHSLETFWGLQKQIWWYHTGLKATHDYASPWWSWPLNLYPVWYFVEYHKNNTMSNIFASGNPAVFWLGVGAILMTFWDYIKKQNEALLIILLGFFVFWLPWAFSPRIMFLYHFSPSVPFLSLALGYQLTNLRHEKNYHLNLVIILGVILVSFLLIYPILTGIPLPRDLTELFFRTNLTKNPFK